MQNKVLGFLLGKILLLVIAFNCAADSLAPNFLNTDALQQNSITTNYTFSQIHWDKTLTLNGYKPNYIFYLPIAKQSNPQKAILHLKMAFSPLLTEGTRVEIKFNQILIRSITLPENLSQDLNLDLQLPLTQLSENWQSLSFSAYLTSSKSLCDPNIWIYISPESSLTLTTLPSPSSGLLNQLPYPFIDPLAIPPVATMLLLPNKPSPEEIFSLLKVAMQLGQLADSKVNLSADFMDVSEEKQKENNLILIGTKNGLFNDAKLNTTVIIDNQVLNSALTKGAGVLLLSQSPFNPFRAALTFVGNDDKALEKAISAFLMPEFLSLASGKIAVVDEIQISKTIEVIGNWYQTSFKSLGYINQSVSGVGRHQLTYNIPLPNDRIPTHALVKTFITAPIFSNKDYSQITLLVNGLKQSSFRINQEHSAWLAEIDNSALKPGVNKLDYLIDLHLENEQCTRQNYDEVWATIHAETEFKTSFANIFPLSMLNQLPVPFNGELTVIIPRELAKETLNNLTNLFFKLGQLFKPTPINISFLTADKVSEEYIRSHNIILLGTLANNPWIKFALDYLPVKLSQNARIMKLPQKEIQLSGDGITGLLELMPSPWSEGKAILLITGNNEVALSLAIKALIKDETRMELDGNIALINSDGSSKVLNSYDNRFISLKNRIKIFMTNFFKNIFYYLENHPQAFIYLLAVLVPLIILLRQRRK